MPEVLAMKERNAVNFESSDSRKLLLALWFFLALLFLIIDFFTGPFIQFPFLYVLPVVFASWYNGRWWGFGYSLALPLVRLYYNTVWTIPWTMVESSVNAAIRIAILGLLAYFVDRVAKESSATKKEVKLLEGLLPICASCKKIRDSNNEWQQLEAYITHHSQAKFTHGVCPECAQRLYGIDPDSVRK
jgi:K+-sensing histidine kinase KdpD